MVAAREYYPRFTSEEYFAWEQEQSVRHEYIDGEVSAMTGGTVNHGQIGVNFTLLLGNHLRGSGCRVLSSDVKVGIQASNDYVYPDLSVTCNDRDRTAIEFISYPCTIVEVLSPSTEAYNRGDKFKLYRRSTTLRDYVLVSSDKIAIDLYRKDERDRWEIINYTAGDVVELDSVNLTFPIEQAFEGITFEISA